MSNILTGLTLWISMVVFAFWIFRKEFSLSSKGRKKIKIKYVLPYVVYLAVTSFFARQIIAFIGPCTIETVSGPVGGMIVNWAYPTFNALFFIIYSMNILCLLTLWEPTVKFSEIFVPLAPITTFIGILISVLLISGSLTSVMIIKPLGVWLIFMVITYSLTTVIIIRDLKKQFKQDIISQQKQRLRDAEAGKNKKKVLLIAPVSDLAAGFGHHLYYRIPPLSLGILSALTSRDRFYVELIDEQFDPFVYQDADLVAITAYTTNAPRAYEIAGIYRKNGIPVVMGGIHASMMTDEALQFVDSVVIGEAEEVWPTVLADFLNGTLKPVYRGEYPSLENRTIPDRTIFDKRYMLNSIQTSRGCPWNCDFCSVTKFNGRRYRQRPVEEILDELETIPNHYILFVDDNLIGYSKAAEQRALMLFKGMVKRKLSKRWISQTTIDIGTKPELLKWAAKSGCTFLFIGLEFTDKEQLKAVNKHAAINVDYAAALKKINRYGIGVLGSFMYGGELETEARMIKRAKFIARDRVDIMQQMILTPMIGTTFWQALKKENRLLYTNYPADWEKYNGLALTYAPRNMSVEKFITTYQACMLKTYALPTLWLKALRTLFHTRRIEVTVGAMRLNFAYRSYVTVNIKKQKQWLREEQNNETDKKQLADHQSGR